MYNYVHKFNKFPIHTTLAASFIAHSVLQRSTTSKASADVKMLFCAMQQQASGKGNTHTCCMVMPVNPFTTTMSLEKDH